MTTYKVYLTEKEEGYLLLSFKDNGQINGLDFSASNLTSKRMEQIFRSLPVSEEDFIKRANRGMTKFEKI